jgi:GDP-D-mannose dehydratase
MLGMSTRALETRTDPALARPADVPMLVADNARLVGATAWQPQITIDTTLADVLTAARSSVT